MSAEVRAKTVEDLKRQTSTVSSVIGEQIVPPSYGDAVYTMPENHLRRFFPVRWTMYTNTLRRQDTSGSAGRVRLLNRLDTYVSDYHAAADPFLTARQEEAVEALSEKMEDGNVVTQGYFEIPQRVSRNVLSEVVQLSDVRTLVVSPTRYDAGNIYDSLTESGNGTDVGRVFAQHKERERRVAVTTYASLARDLADGAIDPAAYDLVVINQAHEGLTDRRKALVEQFTGALKLGFTSTPKYSEEKQVADFLGPEIISIKTKDASRQGDLSPFSVYEVRTGVNLSQVRVTSDRDYSETELRNAVNTERRNQAVVSVYKRKKFAGLPALAYCAGVDHAESLAAVFAEEGISAEVVSGRQTPAEQRDAMLRFTNGDTQVLCNADILVKDFDVPGAAVCLNARPTLSEVMAANRGAKVLLPDDDNPQKHAYIIDFIDYDRRRTFTPVRYADVVENKAFGLVLESFGEGSGESRTPNALQTLEVEIGDISIDIRDILSVFDDLVRDDTTRAKLSLSVGTLVGLLGKDPEMIADQLPFYFKGSPKRIAEAVRQPSEKLEQFRTQSDQEMELPAIVVERMLIDGIYHRIFARTIVDELPQFADSVIKAISPAAEALPALQERVDALRGLWVTAIAEQRSGYALQEAVSSDFAAEYLRLERAVERVRLSPSDAGAAAINESLHETRLRISDYKEDEVRTIRRSRLETLLKEQPERLVQFVTTGSDASISSLYRSMYDLADREGVRRSLTMVTSRLLMERDVQGNIVDSLKAFTSGSYRIGKMQGVAAQFGELRDAVREVESMHTVRIRNNAVDLYGDFSGRVARIFADVTAAIDKGSTGRKGSGMSAGELEDLGTMRQQLAEIINNTRVVRREIVDAFGRNPELLTEFDEAYRRREGIEDTRLVEKIYNNSQFIH